MSDLPLAVQYIDGVLHLLDQRRLPHEEIILELTTVAEVFEAIQTLTVRGAPAIGIAAAYGLLLQLEGDALQPDAFNQRCDTLISARPTAVNLSWAVERMRTAYQQCQDVNQASAILLKEAQAIHEEDLAACRAIGEAGLPLVRDHPRLLTHCNAGSLAVSALGTALAPMYLAHEEGIEIHVYVDETRPLLQGARLTAYELSRSGIDCTLIADNMAAHIMSEGGVDMVIVGADRIAANGDAANKIGTLNLAILCHHFDIPFYVAVPKSTIDPATSSGEEIVIEERDPSEVKSYANNPVAPAMVAARSPAFDVTPNRLITGIITDGGLLSAPFDESISKLMSD